MDLGNNGKLPAENYHGLEIKSHVNNEMKQNIDL
jgi:hypothetical protein